MIRLGSLFTGGGGWEEGLTRIIHPGIFKPVFGAEYEPWIAANYAQNFGDHVVVGDIDAIPDSFFRRHPVDMLVSSPPCQRHSRSGKAAATRHGAGTGKAVVCKIDVGINTVRVARLCRAKVVLLEEVPDFQNAPVFQQIKTGLARAGFKHQDAQVLQAAQYGSPTMRRRLIFRAGRHPLPSWPLPQPPTPWFPAIADLIPEMPRADLATWQEVGLRYCPHPPLPLFIAGGNPTRCGGKVKFKGRMYQVYRVGKGADEPGWTIQLSKNSSGNRVIDSRGVVRQLTVPALGRLQGFTPDYKWPKQRSHAIHIIGNSVPPPLAAQVAYKFVAELAGDDTHT
jgi:site-specific DNA-cytosine methylase